MSKDYIKSQGLLRLDKQGVFGYSYGLERGDIGFGNNMKKGPYIKKLGGSHCFPPIIMPQYSFRVKAPEFSRMGEDFTVWFLEGVLENNPDYVDCLMYLGNAYTAFGRHQEGLRIDQRLASLRPKDPIIHYNLACSYSLVGEIDSAFEALEKATVLGYRDIRHIEKDKDLDNLRKDKRYQDLVGRLRDKEV